MAIVGLLIGVGLYLASPPSYQASTTLLLTLGPEATPGTAILDDQAIAQSRAVAGLAVHKLGLQESVSSFLAVVHGHRRHRPGAPHHGQCAVEQRGGTPGEGPGRGVPPVPGGPAGDRSRSSCSGRSTSRSPRPSSRSRRSASRSASCRPSPRHPHSRPSSTACGRSAARRPRALSSACGRPSTATRRAPRRATASEVKGSEVLDAAAPIPPHSRLKHLLLYAAIGLIAGLALGLGIVVIRALVSDRLRRRDDVAHALGAPVKLSVGTVRLQPLAARPTRARGRRSRDIQRIVAHLGTRCAGRSSQRPRRPGRRSRGRPHRSRRCPWCHWPCPARSEGEQVVVADLCQRYSRGAPAGGRGTRGSTR